MKTYLVGALGIFIAMEGMHPGLKRSSFTITSEKINNFLSQLKQDLPLDQKNPYAILNAIIEYHTKHLRQLWAAGNHPYTSFNFKKKDVLKKIIPVLQQTHQTMSNLSEELATAFNNHIHQKALFNKTKHEIITQQQSIKRTISIIHQADLLTTINYEDLIFNPVQFFISFAKKDNLAEYINFIDTYLQPISKIETQLKKNNGCSLIAQLKKSNLEKKCRKQLVNILTNKLNKRVRFINDIHLEDIKCNTL